MEHDQKILTSKRLARSLLVLVVVMAISVPLIESPSSTRTPAQSAFEKKIDTIPQIEESGFSFDLEYPANDSFKSGAWPGGTLKNVENHHKTVMLLDFSDTEITVSNEFASAQESGVIEFYVAFSSNTADHHVKIYDGSTPTANLAIDIKFGSDGNVQALISRSPDTYEMGQFGECHYSGGSSWYHVLIEFTLASGGIDDPVMGSSRLDQYTYNVWLNTVLQFKGLTLLSTNNLKRLEFVAAGDMYVDAVDYSWNSGHKNIVVDPTDVMVIGGYPFSWKGVNFYEGEVVHDIIINGDDVDADGKLTVTNGSTLYVDGYIHIYGGELAIEGGATVDARDGLVYDTTDNSYIHIRAGDSLDVDVCVENIAPDCSISEKVDLMIGNLSVGTNGSAGYLYCDGICALCSPITTDSPTPLEPKFINQATMTHVEADRIRFMTYDNPNDIQN
ncbi:MAG: hypothetical protein Q6373_016360, partial [Candidatus Sigynarchaeota archaeon]